MSKKKKESKSNTTSLADEHFLRDILRQRVLLRSAIAKYEKQKIMVKKGYN